MNEKWTVRVLGAALLVLALVIALIVLWPEAPAPPASEPSARAARPQVPVSAATATAPAPAPVEQPGPTEEAAEDPTPYCTTIVQWHRRNVPAWVIEDNMMAQGMKFDEAELACLTASSLPPQILDFAEQNVRRPQPR